MIGKGLSIQGYSVSELVENDKRRSEASHVILRLVETGKLHPKISKSFDLSDFQAAYQAVKENKDLGRVLLKP